MPAAFPQPPGRVDARRAGPFHHFQRRRFRRGATSVSRLHRFGLPIAARKPRFRAHQVGQPRGTAGYPAALSVEPARLRYGRRRHEAAAENHAPAGHAPLYRRGARARARLHGDSDLLAFARATGSTVFHPTSTCRMGSDATAVVDERLRVRGIERLRVVDGSIMPAVVSGNTNAAVVMIGERRRHDPARRRRERAGRDPGVNGRVSSGGTDGAGRLRFSTAPWRSRRR